MRRRVNFFDALFALAVLSALFTVGLHLGKERAPSRDITMAITLRIEKKQGDFESGSKILVDGKHEAEILDVNESEITILCKGSLEYAGYLAFGAKYVSKNQPIEASGEKYYLKGRIYAIKKYVFPNN